MFRSGAFLFLFIVLCSFGNAQRDIEKREIRIEPKPTAPPRRPPRIPPVRARIPTQGVLLVLTDPPAANVTIKNSRGEIVKQGKSENGELRAELPAGKYDVEVTADKYYPYPLGKGKLVAPSRPQTVQAYLKPTTGSVIIGPVDTDVTILINEKKPADFNIRLSTKKEEKQIELEDVPEGYHTLSITGPNIADWKREKVQVQGGATSYVTTEFQMAVVNLIVRSEPGANVYVDGRYEGSIQSNGELRIPGKYKPGTHTIKAEHERESFEPSEKTDNFKIGDAKVELKLNRIKFSPEFSDSFPASASFWDAPKTWQVTSGKMLVRDSEVGLRSNVYNDFTMTFDISFANQKGAAWIVRARDKKNYYIFQLSGPKGAIPRVFQSYICQNGQLKKLSSDPVVEDLSRPNDFYTITIEAKGPRIKHFIKLRSNPTGGSEALSTLTDSTFSYGAIGFGTIDGEEFFVYFVNVAPDESKTR